MDSTPLRPPAQWLPHQAARHPTRTALILEGATLDYAGLGRRVATCSDALRAQGVRPGEVFAFAAAPALDAMILIQSGFRLGAVPLPLEPRLPQAVREGLIASTGTEWWVTWAEGPPLAHRLHRESPADASPAAPLDRVQLIIATTGSTGRPKGVMLTGRNLAAAVAASRARIDLGAEDRWLCCLPQSHIGGISVPLRGLEAGAAVVLHEGFDVGRVLADLHGYRCTHLSLVPTQLKRLVESGRPPPASLRVALVGGAALSPSLAQAAVLQGWPLCPSYGLSECTSQVATRPGIGLDWQAGTVGRPLDGVELRIDSEGRIRVRGATVMAGYANPRRRPGEGIDPDGAFTTADLGQLDEAGGVRLLGRGDQVIVTGGEKVLPGLVEEALLLHPEVGEAAVIGWDDAEWGEVVVAVYTGAVDEGELASWLGGRLQGPWRPKRLIRVDALPRTPLGKVDYSALRGVSV